MATAAPAQDMTQAVLALLTNALSTVTTVQKEAEQAIRTEIDLHPEMMIGTLVQLISKESTPPEARSLCAILLRRNLPIGETMIIDELSPTLQSELKRSLLAMLSTEPVASIRKLLCDTIATLAQITLYRGQWDSLIPSLDQMSMQPSESLREAALIVLGKLGDALPDVQGGNLGALVTLFSRGLADTSLGVRNASLNAVSATFSHVDETQISHFNTVRSPVLHVVRDALVANDDSAATAMSSLISMASRAPAFFRADFQLIVQMVTHIIINKHSIDVNVQQLTLECTTSIIEGAPNASRKCTPLLETSLSLALSLMVAFDEEEEIWNHPSKSWEASEDSGFSAGEAAVDRISRGIGGKKITPIIVHLVNTALGDKTSWKPRFAALMALTQASEVISSKKLPDMVGLVLQFINDESPFVQFAAINCMGQMCTDFGPDIQNDYHGHILPALLSAMDEVRHPRVQSHAAAAIINFSEHCKGNILQAYSDLLVSKLFNMLQRPQRIIQEQAMTAIASVAECISKSFAKFYDHFVPLLKFAIMNSNGDDSAMFRGRALECITFIGMAVGNERFAPDAKEVMELTIKIVQAGAFASDDPSYSYMVQAWTRICNALGPNFAPYCHVIVPTVLRSAQTKCVVGKLDDDGNDDISTEQQIFEIGDEQYGISTNQIEEKSLGCSALGSFAATLKKDFFPYLRPTVETFLPLLKFHFEESVKQSCAIALPDLLFCALDAREAGLCDNNVPQELALISIKSLLDALQEEEDVYVMSSFVNAIQLCFDKCGEWSSFMFPSDVVKAIRDQLIKMVEQSGSRTLTLASPRVGDDAADEEEDEDERMISDKEAEAQLQYMLAECFGSMIKRLNKHFLPVFHETLPTFMLMLDPASGVIARKIAIFVFDDFVESMGAEAGPYLSPLLPCIGRYLTDPDPDIRQAVAFGFAVCAQHAGAHFAMYAAASAQSLVSMIQHSASKQGGRRATDNAVAALGRIIRYQADSVDCAQLSPVWLGMLPIRDDVHESAICGGILCDLVESNNAHLLGVDMCNLPRIVHILVEIVNSKLSNEALNARIVPILKQLPVPIMSQIVGKLPDQLREKLDHLR